MGPLSPNLECTDGQHRTVCSRAIQMTCCPLHSRMTGHKWFLDRITKQSGSGMSRQGRQRGAPDLEGSDREDKPDFERSFRQTSFCCVLTRRDILSGPYDNTVRLWNAGMGEIERVLKGDRVWSAVALSPAGTHMVSGHLDTSVLIWDIITGESTSLPPFSIKSKAAHTFPGQFQHFAADQQVVSLSLDRKWILTDRRIPQIQSVSWIQIRACRHRGPSPLTVLSPQHAAECGDVVTVDLTRH